MKILALDLETTGLDILKDDVTEIGYVLCDTNEPKPLVCVSELIYKDGVKVPQLITEITHITDDILCDYGVSPHIALERLRGFMEDCDYVVAHNGNNFDKPFLYRWAEDNGCELPQKHWLDTKEDIEYPRHLSYRNLSYLCAEHGFLNPFPHAALFDAMATMKLLRHYDIEAVVALSKVPHIVVRAMVDYNKRELAKERRYMWEKLGDKKYHKSWIKKIRENKLEEEIEEAPFKVEIIKE